MTTQETNPDAAMPKEDGQTRPVAPSEERAPLMGRLSFWLSLALALGGGAAAYLIPAWWSELVFSVGAAAFVGCATNALAIRALFDPWPSTTLGLRGTGIIRLRADEIATEVGHAVGENILTPAFIKEKSRSALESAVDSGYLDSDELYFEIRKMIKEWTGRAGVVANITGWGDYDDVTHRVIDKIKERAGKLTDPSDTLGRMLEQGVLSIDVESIVREKLQDFGPQGLRDMSFKLTRKHLVWLEFWGAVFGGIVGVPMWYVMELTS